MYFIPFITFVFAVDLNDGINNSEKNPKQHAKVQKIAVTDYYINNINMQLEIWIKVVVIQFE